MSVVRITGLVYTAGFAAELRKAPPEMRAAAMAALELLLKNPNARALRLHTLPGYPKPTIYKIDIDGPRWQITFELDGETAVLLRVAPHKRIDRRPR